MKKSKKIRNNPINPIAKSLPRKCSPFSYPRIVPSKKKKRRQIRGRRITLEDYE